MLDQTTKRKIDSARNILVGKVPDPKAQVEQITTALIYKFMDDMDKESEELGGEAQFFSNGFEKYSWTKLMDKRLSGQERLERYVEAITSMSKNPHVPQLFRDIFKDAFLPYRDYETLSLFLKEIDGFNYDHSENLGNAFEYLLSVLGSQGDAGQFRTPRHIIDFIVEVVDPKKNEKVLDPACGTAGFLISAYKHILKHNSSSFKPDKEKAEEVIEEGETASETILVEKEIYNGDNLAPEEKAKVMENIAGYDISPDMVKLSLVNLYLHGFSNPKIFEYDTLASEKRWEETSDVIMANPPFMTPKGGIRPHKRFQVQANRSEVLFVDYILEHLNVNGRAGIIVPEGIIFQSSNAYKQLRKLLIEDGLFAVASLPPGVFNPYSGVKTSILFFDNHLAKQSDEILFVKVENDGFDLGAQRRKIKKNDLPQALDILNKWKTNAKVESNLVLYVEKSKITENSEYLLSSDRYRVATDYTNAKWPMMKLGKIIKINFGERITKNEKQGTKYPVYGGGGESFRTDNFNRENEYVVARFAMSENCVRYVNGQFWMMDSGGTFSIKPEYEGKLNKDYIGKILLNRQKDIFMCARGGAQKNINVEHFYELKIPLPPLEIQEHIVAELDGYQKIISGARQIVTNWNPKIVIDPEWEKLKLSDVCDITSSKRIFQEEYVTSGTPFYRTKEIVELSQGKEISLELFITDTRFEEIKNKFSVPEKGDILISAVGTIGVSWVVQDDRKFYFKDGNLLWLRNFKDVEPSFVKLMLDITVANNLHLLTNGAAYNALTIIKLKGLKIPLPSLAIQKEIVEKIQAERELVESAKKLIEIYEQKMSDVLGEI